MNARPEDLRAVAEDVSDARPARTLQAQVVPERYPATTSAPATPQDLLRIAIDTGADLDRLEKLMDLQTKWEAGEARKAFSAALSAFKGERVDIVKSKQVGYETSAGDFVGYKHAELADCTAAIAPALARHGLGFRWDVKQEGNQVIVTCLLSHKDGHSESIQLQAPPDNSGKKNTIQQIASTVTYLQRYTLLAIAGCATKGEDNDGGGFDDPPPVAAGDADGERDPFFITEEQEIKLRDHIEAHGVDEAKLLRFLKRSKLSEIPATWYDKTVATITQRGGQ